ncbi:MAG: PHP domain-containing protein, partial [Clostridia bacterium]|nr:PHP domain-containing protein [Clostridia bacterium]
MDLIRRFPKYIPSDSFVSVMKDGEVLDTKVDKELRIMQITVKFSDIVRKDKLYALENEIKLAYDVNKITLLPRYDSLLFSSDYIEDVILETYRRGAVSNGFFSDYTIDASREHINIKVPFIKGGIDLLGIGKTNEVISDIIFEEFGIRIPVTISQREDYEKVHANFEREKMSALKKALEEQKKVNVRSAKEEKEADLKEMRAEFKKATSFSSEDNRVEIKDTKITVGAITFDTTSREYVSGGEFEIENVVPISRLDAGMHGIVVLGKVFEITEKPIKRGANITIQIGITDNISSIYVKEVVSADEKDEFLAGYKKGNAYAIKGSVKLDTFDNEIYLNATDVSKIDVVKRMDTAPEKRVELHLHTMMSQMDATIDPEVIVKVAKEWGHKAVAITDHGNVQGFPPAMLASEKLGMKLIYGMEAYLVNNPSL